MLLEIEKSLPERIHHRGLQLLLFVVLTSFNVALATLNFAYFSGDRIDRATINTTIVMELNDMGLMSNGDLGEWVSANSASPQADVVLEAFWAKTKQDPVWYKKFVASLSPQMQKPLQELASQRSPASVEF
jgi:hypothetical protein